jgi:tetratricopeptide (TPR) repeat protein
VYAAVPERLREEYHARFADAYAERLGGSDSESAASGADAALLARHHLRGSRPQEGLPFLDRALEDLVGHHLREAAADLIAVALARDGLLSGARRADLLVRRAGLLDVLGRRDEQLAAAEEARSLAGQLDDPALSSRAERALGVYHISRSDADEALAYLERARALASKSGRADLEIAARSTLSNALVRVGGVDQAQVELEAARELARAEGDQRAECEALGTLGTLLARVGQIHEARAQLALARDLAEELGEPRTLARAESRMGSILLWFGDAE